MSDGSGVRGDARKRQQDIADEQRGLWAIAKELDIAYPADTMDDGARMARLALAERKRQQQWASWTVGEAEKFANAVGASEDSLFVAWVRERKLAELTEATLREVNSRLGHRLGEAEARAEKAEAERDALRAAVAALADEWASSRGPLGWTVNDAVQHQCADELRALLDDPDWSGGPEPAPDALRAVKAQAVRTALVPRHGECDCEYCSWLAERAARIEGGADDE